MVSIRKVVYSNFRGVFLGLENGKVLWSRDKGVEKTRVAPTFLSREEADDFLSVLLPNQEFDPDVEMREVWPKVGISATSEECGIAGLGYWHE